MNDFTLERHKTMRHIVYKLIVFIHSVLLIYYIGLTINKDCSVTELVPVVLSSFMLIDITYISACNIRKNSVISLFCGLLALDSWYLILSIPNNALTELLFSALSPIIWCVSLYFILMFLFQGSGYKYQRLVSVCLTVTCVCALIGLLISEKIFALFYGVQFFISWLCFLFIVLCHRKRTVFVFKAEWKSILLSFGTTLILFSAYYFSTRSVRHHLSNFGIYLPLLLFFIGIHSIILKEHNLFPLSTIFSRCQFISILLLEGVVFGIITQTLRLGCSTFFLMLDALSLFIYGCNTALEWNLKQKKSKIIIESSYHAALRQLQQEEQQNLAFANFLHDNILQDLLSVKNIIGKAAQPQIQDLITSTLNNMNTYIREQMQHYHPAMLPKLTIKENYQNLLAYIAQSFPHRDIDVSFECTDAVFLVDPYHILVYRLLRELVTNIYKHSTGNHAWITLTQENGFIRLRVCDNGSTCADTLQSADISQHRGLTLIAERVKSMDGTLIISDNHPQGICIEITLPMKGDVSYQYFVNR